MLLIPAQMKYNSGKNSSTALSNMAVTKYMLATRNAAAVAKLLQSCPTLCDPIDGSPPCSTISGIVQARTPEWVAISFSNAWK